MAQTEPIHILQKDGWSYVHLGWHYTDKMILVNGTPVEVCPGNDHWGMIQETEITSVAIMRPQRRTVREYRMHKQYLDILTTPATLPADPMDKEHCAALEALGDLSQFYKAEYDDPDPVAEELPFMVIDRNASPVKMPEYVTVLFPKNFAAYPEVHHTHPCSVRYDKVFDIIHDWVSLVVDNSAGKYRRDDFKGIGTLRVQEKIKLNPTRSSPTRASQNREVEVLHIVGSYKERGSAVQIKTIEGKNYEELMANLEVYVQSFVGLLSPGKRQVCPRCEGHGIVDVGENHGNT